MLALPLTGSPFAALSVTGLPFAFGKLLALALQCTVGPDGVAFTTLAIAFAIGALRRSLALTGGFLLRSALAVRTRSPFAFGPIGSGFTLTVSPLGPGGLLPLPLTGSLFAFRRPFAFRSAFALGSAFTFSVALAFGSPFTLSGSALSAGLAFTRSVGGSVTVGRSSAGRLRRGRVRRP